MPPAPPAYYPPMGSLVAAGTSESFSQEMADKKTNACMKHKDSLIPLMRVDNLRNLLKICFDWAIIALAITICQVQSGILAYLIAFIIIGSRQQSLLVLVHEAAHGLLFSNRTVNNVVAEIFLAWPVFSSMRGYRRLHLLHHRFLSTYRDPDWVRSNAERLPHVRNNRELVSLLFGLDALRRITRIFSQIEHQERQQPRQANRFFWTAGRLVYYVAVVSVVSVLGVWQEVACLWLAPFLLYSIPALRFRGISDHWGLEHGHATEKTRTVRVGRIISELLYPNNINFHLAHHLYPSIPYRNLAYAHRILMDDPDYSARAHITHGVSGVIREIIEYAGKYADSGGNHIGRNL
jgi:fatty acid desaturase